MKVTLYQAAEDFRALREQIDPETGEMPEGLGSLQDAARDVMYTKLRGCAAYVLEEELHIDILKAQVKKLQAKIKALEHSVDWGRNYMATNMKLTGILSVDAEDQTFKAALQLARDASVVIDDDALVPDDYKVEVPAVPASMKVDKLLISNAIKDGFAVPGARIVKNDRLVLK